MEVELKLLLAPSDVAVLDLLQRYAVSKPRTRRLTSTYFDTPALDLHRHGLELRVRRDGRQWVQTPAHLYLGRDREALEWARRSVLERPQHAVAHSWVAAAAANLGETETARAALASSGTAALLHDFVVPR